MYLLPPPPPYWALVSWPNIFGMYAVIVHNYQESEIEGLLGRRLGLEFFLLEMYAAKWSGTHEAEEIWPQCDGGFER